MSVDQTDYEGRTALSLLAEKGNKEGVEMLLDRGANVNAVFMYQGRLPMTALDAALQTNRTQIAEVLKEHGGKTGKEITSPTQ